MSSRQWGGALRDDPNNGCEGDYNILDLFGLGRHGTLRDVHKNVNFWT